MKIMIVDDEKPIRQWFESIVMSIPNMEVTGTFANGETALASCRDNLPDLIFTDIIMPVMNGIELIKAVKDQYPEVEILILSNYNDFDYVHQGLKMGARDYLLKAQTGDEEIRDFILKVSEVKKLKKEKTQSDSEEILGYLEKLEEYSLKLTDRNAEEYRRIKEKMMQILDQYRTGPINDNSDFLANRIVEYIRLNYAKPIKLLTLADELNYNADYLSQTFKQKTGKNFNAYLTEVRMEKAKELLGGSNIKIKEVSAQVGYINEMYFSTAFKNYTGMSPKKYILVTKKI